MTGLKDDGCSINVQARFSSDRWPFIDGTTRRLTDPRCYLLQTLIPQGEQQKKLDVITNDVLKNALRFTGRLSVLASEEEDEPVTLQNSDLYKHKRRSDVVVEEGNKVRGGVGRGRAGFAGTDCVLFRLVL